MPEHLGTKGEGERVYFIIMRPCLASCPSDPVLVYLGSTIQDTRSYIHNHIYHGNIPNIHILPKPIYLLCLFLSYLTTTPIYDVVQYLERVQPFTQRNEFEITGSISIIQSIRCRRTPPNPSTPPRSTRLISPHCTSRDG